MPKSRIRRSGANQSGAALFGVLMLAGLMSALVGLMAVSFTGQNTANRRSWKHDRALMAAEIGLQRVLTGLAHENDNIKWEHRHLTAAPVNPQPGFWLWQWQTIKNDKGVEIGRYKLEVMPSQSRRKVMRLKATGLSYDRFENNQAVGGVQRTFGVELRQLTMGDFAIASNHQMGGARINGGARIYGGLLTSGEVHLDASSTGIFNDYVDLQAAQNFSGYAMPEDKPDGQVFVYRDQTLPAGANNGVIKLAAQATLGSSDQPMQGIHTAEDSIVIDPGDGTPGTDGDGIIGAGEERAKGPRDHKLPEIQFPDASSGSDFMLNSEADADNNGNAIFDGDLEFGDTSFTIGSGPALSYDASTGNITIDGPIFIRGNVSSTKPLTYAGKGGLFVDGNAVIRQGLEPVDPATYPADHAIGLVASNIMELGENSGNSSKYAGFFFGNNTIKIEKAKIFGNLFGGTVQMPTTGTRPDIYVHPGTMASTGVELPDFIQTEIIKELWWEMSGNANK
ncbi:MAG: hypothetical protein CVV27_05995 [Candidatus Melainabacteria bacterium HGW-Melainabacteria-1]|nr:MAG: hypothetical protein CVV27_05995 [Candidatus Melainabacteria bacterium HGW-Melainabacteria-1]